jgi:2'-5' RNA ligase
VNAANYHLTLKFLGSIDEHSAVDIGAALSRAVSGIQAFDIALRGLGAFPTPDRARVIWSGVDAGGPALASLAGAVEEALVLLGFPRDARAFSAHVTLGRVREPRRNPALAEALTRAAVVELGSTRVDRVVLMRSDLSPRGARYSELSVAPLAGSLQGDA